MIPKETTEELFIKSLEDLMKKKTFEKITVLEIVENCGAGRSTFYHYFQDKYDLANHMYRKQLGISQEVHRGTDAPEVLLTCLKYIQEHRAYYQNLISYDGQNSFYELVQELSLQWWGDLLESVKKEDGERGEELSYSISFFSTGIAAMIRKWIKEDFRTPSDTLVRYLLRSIPFNLYHAMKDSEMEKYNFV